MGIGSGNIGFVSGTSRITWNDGGQDRSYIQRTRADGDYFTIANNNNALGIQLGTQDGTNPFNPKVTMTSSGNVGIGTVAPDSPLSVKPATNIPQVFLEQNNSVGNAAGWKVLADSALGDLIFYSRQASIDTETVRFGIVSGTPKLTVTGQSRIKADATGTADDSGQLLLKGATNPNITLQMGIDTTDKYGFLRAVENGVFVKNFVFPHGNVGIGTTTPRSKLEIENTGSADDVLLLGDSSGLCEAQPTTTGLTWSCSSDIRLKTNIREPSPALSYLTAIPLKDYTVIKTGENVMGPIAQELLITNLGSCATRRRWLLPSIRVIAVEGGESDTGNN